MTKKQAWGYAAAGAFTALMIGLVIYGVTTHEEAGLLRACTRHGFTLDYSGECRDVVWDTRHAPLPLRTRVVGAEPWQAEALKDAISSLERELDFDAFVVVLEDTPAEVIADFAVPFESGGFNPAGRVRHHIHPETENVIACEVFLQNLALQPVATQVIRHEFGHVLGLAHDANASSLMTDKGFEENVDVDAPTKWFALSEADRELLRRLYVEK